MKLIWLFTTFVLAAFIWNLKAPLQGTHAIRQSDTVFAGYSYCVENTPFSLPRVAHRGNTSGIAIGEFPLYSYLISLPCKVRGSWSEIDPKLIIFLIWALNLIVWLKWARLYFNDYERSRNFIFLFFFSTIGLLYHTISLPDSLALLLIGSASLTIQSKKRIPTQLIATVLFAAAFAMRPYLIPLILLVTPRKTWIAVTTLVCVAVYFAWYKWWAPGHNEVDYYYTSIPPLSEMITSFPHYATNLVATILREWFHFIFIILLIWKWKVLNKIELILAVLSLGLVLLVRGEHVVVHSYYLWASALFAFLALSRALGSLKPAYQNGALVLYGLMGIAQTQHQFHRQAEQRYEEIQNLFKENKIPEQAKIAVYIGEGSCSTQYLYWSKHLGWCFYERFFEGPQSCPTGADYYLKYEGEKPIIGSCISSPTDKPNDK